MDERILKAEILAPVGAPDRLQAAVRCGANAVYLGTGDFNARRNAANFDDASFAEAVSYCHARDIKVHVTLNTLIMDDELASLEREAEKVAAAGADAVIIQDLAVMRLLRDRCPGIKRHASTQMAVHNVDGAKQLRDMGFDRIVLAREMTLGEIEKVCALGIEAESFVHGALCMSLSGGCYLSSIIGGRSGNRGLCAQPCRLDFNLNGRDHALSLKDMSYISRIRELVEAGVSSFKIEGRMKRPEYVAAAVTACRFALEGKEFDEETLKAVFSRGGFTQGYLDGKRNSEMFGMRTKEDAAASAGVFGELASLYRAERACVPVSFRLEMNEEGSRLTAECAGESVRVSGAVPQKAKSRPTDEETAGKALKKTGGTPFFVKDLELSVKGDIMLPAAELNAMRREALALLLEKRGRTQPKEFLPAREKAAPVRRRSGEPEIWARFEKAEQIPERESFARVILPLIEISEEHIKKYGEKLLCELPDMAYPDDEPEIRARLAALCAAGLQGIYAQNLYGVYLAREHGLELAGGSLLNITNTAAAEEYEALGMTSVTASFELAMNRIKKLGSGMKLGAVAYGLLPLMRLRSCPARDKTGCGKCRGQNVLTDRTGARFPLLCRRRKYSVLLNSVPLYVGDRELTGLDYALLYFTLESRGRAEEITRMFSERLPFDARRTAGLYYRTLQ
ncbi:MAG: U32 family peptidase [Oscillospiraceae bacterium]|nr:U32 family peptidase [Oscillospiraceae bacterium]